MAASEQSSPPPGTSGAVPRSNGRQREANAPRDLTRTAFEVGSVMEARTLEGEVMPQGVAEYLTLASPARVAITARREKGLLHITGTVEGRANLACARCLMEYTQPLRAGVDRYYRAGPDEADGQSGERRVEDDIASLPDGVFAVAPLVGEELVLALPMIPLCQASCRGLCPGCGADLNREACRCGEPPAEGPFAVLKSLKLR